MAERNDPWRRVLAGVIWVPKRAGSWITRYPSTSALIAGLGLLLATAYFVAPPWLGPKLPDVDSEEVAADWKELEPPERLAARNDQVATQNQIRTTSLQLVAGLVVLAGAVATWENIRLRRHDQLITREGQITERFTRAIEHLGNPESLDIRLGGIHALERIARDSPADLEAVRAVLSAFVRRSVIRRREIQTKPSFPSARDRGPKMAKAG